MDNKNKKNVLIVCHDAGAAEIISAYVKKNRGACEFRCLIAGPALKIFSRKKLYDLRIDKKTAMDLLAKKKFNLVLTGTSWLFPLEIEFIKLAKEKKINTAVYLDHWTNYRERFNYPASGWKKNLPAEFWAGDKYAYKLIKKFFPRVGVKLVPNLYWQEIRQTAKSLNKQNKSKAGNILFMSEPIINTTVNFFGRKTISALSEFKILESLLKYFSENKIKNKLIICFHPTEKRSKYDELISRYNQRVNVAKQDKDVLLEISQAVLVIGMMGMILTVAAILKKKTVSYLPDKKMKCPLPVKNIIKINKLIKLDKIIKHLI